VTEGGVAAVLVDDYIVYPREEGRKMKIKSIEVETDFGRRHIQLTAPIDVDPTSEVPPAQFRSLTDLLWNVLRQVAIQSPQLAATAPKVEA
jgi:hypothetical protein